MLIFLRTIPRPLFFVLFRSDRHWSDCRINYWFSYPISINTLRTNGTNSSHFLKIWWILNKSQRRNNIDVCLSLRHRRHSYIHIYTICLSEIKWSNYGIWWIFERTSEYYFIFYNSNNNVVTPERILSWWRLRCDSYDVQLYFFYCLWWHLSWIYRFSSLHCPTISIHIMWHLSKSTVILTIRNQIFQNKIKGNNEWFEWT